jgi:hypothetical protein
LSQRGTLEERLARSGTRPESEIKAALVKPLLTRSTVLCALAAVALADGTSPGDELATLRSDFADRLHDLADKCDELSRGDPQVDLAQQARITRGWLPALDPGRQYAFLPGETAAAAKPAKYVPEWQAKFLALRREYAEKLFAQAEAAHRGGRAAEAYRLLHEVLRENPAHDAARAMLSLDDAESGIRVRRGETAEPTLGWEARGYWRVESPHFEIVTNVASGGEARQMAQRLESVFAIWRQLFFEFWSDDAVGEFSFVKRTLPQPKRSGRHRVVVFREKHEYVVRLTSLGASGAAQSEGYYADERKQSFFYADEAALGTWYHEITHQLFQETGSAVSGVAADDHVWIVEGIAMYMESLQQRDGCFAVGGFDARRLQYARHRRLVDGYHVPLAELSRLGRKELAEHKDIRQLYSEACGLTHFLMDSGGGRYRGATIRLLKEIYAGRARPDTLAALTGQSPEALDAQYAEFLADVDDEDLARHLSPPERITALALPGTRVTDAGVDHLTACTNLEWLDLSGTQVSDVGIAQLAQATKLQRLSLRKTDIGDAALETIASFNQLDDLNLAHTRVTDEGMQRLFPPGKPSPLNKLTALWLEGTAVGDATLAQIGRLGALEALDLAATRVTDDGLAHTAPLRKLLALYLSQTAVSDAGLAPLRRLRTLELVQLDGTRVTPAGADALKAALPDAQIVLRLE